MENINIYISEKLSISKDVEKQKTSIELEMEEWEKRMETPFGKCLKELQSIIVDLKLYPLEKNEYGLYTFTPFDNYVTAFALDNNPEYTYKHIKDICDNYDYSQYKKVEKCLKKLEKLI